MNSYSRFIHYKNCIVFLNLFNVRSCKDLGPQRCRPEMEQLLTMSGLKFDPSCSISPKPVRVSGRVGDKNVERIIGHGSN
jgi:hypothetical protein